MNRIVIITLSLLALTTPAAVASDPPGHPAAPPNVYGPKVSLCPGAARTFQTRSIPRNGHILRITAFINGHEARGWLTSRQGAELAGHGVLVVVAFTRSAGPAYVRLATARPTCARVKVVIAWR